MRTLSEYDSKGLLKKHGILCISDHLSKSREEARIAAKKLGFPVILKIASPDILHKTDVGGVKSADSIKEVEEAFDKLTEIAKKKKARVNGVLVEPKLRGIELIIGVNKDPQFDHVIMFGLGGVFVELFRDVGFRAIPLDRKDAEELIEDMRSRKILDGFRDIGKVDNNKIVEVLLKVSRMVEKRKDILELDINPLFVNEKICIVADALIKLQ